MKKTVKIFDLGGFGQGVAKDDKGKIIFVPYALTGETVEIEIQNQKSKFQTAKLCKILSESKNRVTPPCPYFSLCGGCDIQHMDYASQLTLKTNTVKNALKSIGRINAEVLPCVPCENPYHYRNKMVFAIKDEIGMFKQNSHEVIAIDRCLIDENFSKKVISVFNQFIRKNNITSYDEKSKKGLLKYLVVRSLDNAFLFTLVTGENKLPDKEKLIELLKDNFDNFGLYLNINKQNTSEIMSPDFVHLHGLTHLTKTENEITYDIGPYSFLQVNDYIKNLIYLKVAEILKNDEIVIDAFSGAGLLGALVSKRAKKVMAVEINKEASEYANNLMAKNNIKNVESICGNCNNILPELTKNLSDFSLILDPPRSGLENEIIATIKKSKPNKIIYISCNAATLARDIKNFDEYKIEYIQPYDMFPQTRHIETVVYMTKI